ncbi:MAG: hypothetical protein E5Y74_11050 [Mesorhizobium sp.]|nr:MAG: hypothetical protein E5Y74_11050 [Mesorhizobium sp.]
MFGQWSAFGKRLRSYFSAYGGVPAVIGSPIFGIAVVITALNYSEWMTPNWVSKTEALIPSLLGFSLGTYAILFSLISNRLKGALQKVLVREGVSYLHAINATFFHFIIVQVVALAWAFLFEGTWFRDVMNLAAPRFPFAQEIFWWGWKIGSFMGYLLLIYSFLLMIAAALAVYRLALIKDPSDG